MTTSFPHISTLTRPCRRIPKLRRALAGKVIWLLLETVAKIMTDPFLLFVWFTIHGVDVPIIGVADSAEICRPLRGLKLLLIPLSTGCTRGYILTPSARAK